MKKILWKVVPCLAAVALGWFLASAHYGRVIKAQKEQLLLSLDRIRDDLRALETSSQKSSQELKSAGIKLFGVFASVVKAHEIHNEFEKNFIANRSLVFLYDSLEQLLIKKEFGTQLPKRLKEEWELQRRACQNGADEAAARFFSEQETWGKKAVALGLIPKIADAVRVSPEAFLAAGAKFETSTK